MLLLALFACLSPGSSKAPQSSPTTPTADLHDSAEPPDSGDPDTGSLPDGFDPIRAAAADSLRGGRATGVSVAIWHRGELVFAEGFGSAHPDRDQPVTPDTLFGIGSDTKKLTAIALLQLGREGAVDLDAPLSAALPGLSLAHSPDWASTVTPRQLISHQGGLWDYTPWEEHPDDAELSSRADGVFAERIWQQSPPGAFWNYANPNFSVAGLVAEEADGRPYGDLIRARILDPLGLDHTFTRESELEGQEDVAIGSGLLLGEGWDAADPWFAYTDAATYEQGTIELADSPDDAFTRPAGLLWSTASDMARLGGFLIEGDSAVLDPADQADLTTAWAPVYPSISAHDLTGYGYGLFVGHRLNLASGAYDIPVWSHGGNTLTHTSAFYILPDQELVIAALSNGYGDELTGVVVAAIESLVLDELGEPLADAALPTAQDPLESYTGTYVDPWLGEIIVTTDGVDLYASIPAFTEAGLSLGRKLKPYYTDCWTIKMAGAETEFTFIDGPDGTPNQFVRSRGFVGTRVDSPPPALPHPPAAALRSRLLGLEPGGVPRLVQAPGLPR